MTRTAWIGTFASALALTLFALPGLLLADDQQGVKTGEAAPDFTLTDTDGTEHQLSDFKGKVVVLEWMNKDCPFVKKFYNEGHMQGWQQQYTDSGDVVWLTICSSAPGKQGHMNADGWNSYIESNSVASSAVLMDEDGKVGKRYAAKTTPHIYVIDGEGTLRYQGAIDSKRSTKTSDIDGADNYLAAAVDAILAGEEVKTTDTAPYGCGVKY
jgi:peroxiredoxin